MKKKPSIKEKREQGNAQRMSAFKEQEAKRNEAIAAQKKAEEEAARKKKLEALQKSLRPVNERKLSAEMKSTAKAAGLKSTFVLGNQELLMTSFGRGNKAIVEKHIIGDEIVNLADPANLTITPDTELHYKVDGRRKNASTDNPLYHKDEIKIRDDLIHARSALEKQYYGKNFEDNIHIQCIYSILDIEKILSVHINNIVYMLTNFLRVEGQDTDEMISYLTKYKDYEDLLNSTKSEAAELRTLFFKLCEDTPQLGYLNLEVTKPLRMDGKAAKKKQDPNTIKLSQEEFFYVLYAFGIMRQMLVHGNPNQNIYKIEGFGSHPKIAELLNRLYKERVEDLNKGFISKAGKNLSLMFKAFGIKEKEKKASFVRDYYDFTVRKKYKNTGFSIKILRETILRDVEEAMEIRKTDYDSVRGKLYPFMDFAIYRYYVNHKDIAENLVGELRASMNEVEKDEKYRAEAMRLWPQISDLVMHHILPEMNGTAIKETVPDKDVTAEMLKDVLISTDATQFSKMIYLATLFINGKEINDLLTTLIHQFENIASFTHVMESQKLETKFQDSFSLFALSDQVSEELRVINSFARMSKESASAKGMMLEEAFKVLGIKADENWLKQEIKIMLDSQGKTSKDETVRQKRGVRNFIINNVIESDRFKYLVRYGNVNKIKGIAQNRKVVAFVLKEIPDAQIVRYYNSVTGNDGDFRPEMREMLADYITGFSFDDISDVRQRDGNDEAQEDKRRKQALVRMYLSVIYLALKNLVYINSRYSQAFHCLERDRLLLNREKWAGVGESKKEEPGLNLADFARDFLEKYPQKKRVSNYLNQNFANSDPWAIKVYRNKIDHLDAVRNADIYLKDIREFNSWFELYHYILQRSIMNQFEYEKNKPSKKDKSRMVISEEELNPKTLEYMKKVAEYKTCCRDFVKALNIPFAYNLPRFKNLSIDGLFDKNRPGNKGDGKKLALEEE